MELELIRKWLKDTYTIGKLKINGEYFCDTLEDVVSDLHDYNHDGQWDDKIYGQTAIPAGRYEIKMTWWEKHQGFYPMLQDVPGFSGILIHGGVTAKDTEGCILVGRNMKIGRLENSPYYKTTLIQKIQEAEKKGEKVFITIKQ